MNQQLEESFAKNVIEMHRTIHLFWKNREEVFAGLSAVKLDERIGRLEESLEKTFDILIELVKKLKGEKMAEEGQPPYLG
mgnify:CR=1 FL=1